MVSATAEASRAGAELLDAGGNAVDAAVATALALAVTYPQAGNLAGGGFLVARSRDGSLFALDFRETAPAAAGRTTFAAPGADSLTGGLAVAVPATVRGLEEAHRRLGRLPWARCAAPAIRLARDGFVVPGGLAQEIVAERKRLLRFPGSRRLFFPGGKPLAAGERLVQPDLARTLEAVARKGSDALHRGPIAQAIVDDVRRTGGILTLLDLASYRPLWRAPAEATFRGLDVVTMPLPSSGGFLVTSILAQLAVAGGAGEPDLDTPEGVHLFVEAARRAYADRNEWLGDPDCVAVPLARLLAPARLAALGASIDRARATPSASLPSVEARAEREETTHLVVATPDGEAVSLTTTLNGVFGNASVVPGAGFLLNDEMDDFATRPGVPNLFGLVQGEANAVRPGARPLSSMTPALVLDRRGKLRLVVGSPGGSTIPTTVLQVILRAAAFDQPLPDAVAAARFHHQHLPDQVSVERGAVPPAFEAALRALGHAVQERESIGRVHAIEVLPDGRLVGAADPRGYGAPAAARAASAPRSAP